MSSLAVLIAPQAGVGVPANPFTDLLAPVAERSAGNDSGGGSRPGAGLESGVGEQERLGRGESRDFHGSTSAQQRELQGLRWQPLQKLLWG